MERDKKIWTKTDQALWDCAITALRGLKNSDWFTLKQYEDIRNSMQELVFGKITKEKHEKKTS